MRMNDWSKLVWMMKCLAQTANYKLTLWEDKRRKLPLQVIASFTMHPNYHGHTSATLTLGKGAISSISRKQGMNTQRSYQSRSGSCRRWVSWSYDMDTTVPQAPRLFSRRHHFLPDSKSAMLLEGNGRTSSGNRSRHLNAILFFVLTWRDRAPSQLSTAQLIRWQGTTWQTLHMGRNSKGSDKRSWICPLQCNLWWLHVAECVNGYILYQ